MEEFQEPKKKVIQILSVIAIIAPSILETQKIGVALDTITVIDFVEGVFWGLLIQRSYVLAPSSDSLYVIMPYFTSSLITIFVWFVGCLSPVVVYFVLTQKIRFRAGFFSIVILSIVPFFPGIPEYIVGDGITYNRTPLVIPQILCLGVLVYYYWKQRKVTPNSSPIG